ncbi:MAG: transglycosylase family protein [Pseudonocardia sp.]
MAVIGAIAIAVPLGITGTATAHETRAAGSPWDRLAKCESGGNWKINTGNGYYGGLQFSPRTWRGHGGKGMPHKASKAEQIRIAQKVLKTQGWGAWPACSRKLGLRG